jgi:hypothetical protein
VVLPKPTLAGQSVCLSSCSKVCFLRTLHVWERLCSFSVTRLHLGSCEGKGGGLCAVPWCKVRTSPTEGVRAVPWCKVRTSPTEGVRASTGSRWLTLSDWVGSEICRPPWTRLLRLWLTPWRSGS